MDHRQRYWHERLDRCREALERKGFEVHSANGPGEAADIVLRQILPKTGARTVSWGDSMTLGSTGILDVLRNDPAIELVVTFDPSVPRPEIIERRRKALLVDLFLTGSNAVTEAGELVNLDMVGNRVAGITFGPRHVIILAGRNKIVPDLAGAMDRIKNYAAPINILRHAWHTPCAKTGRCMDCRSPNRICNTWTITGRAFPKGRIKVVLIDADLGL